MKQFFISLLVIVFSLSTYATVRTKPLQKTVALTFDDGPAPGYTEDILAILKKNDIKATFFVVGANAKKYPELVKKIHDEGHVVASHSMTHPMLTKLSEKRLQKEITGPQIVVKKAIGIEPRCLRYPFGASNKRVRAAIRSHGIEPVPMGFNSFDYKRPGTKKIISWVLKHVHNRQIFLFHDGYDKREQTVAALQPIIDGIRKKGYGFSTICG